MPKVECLYCKTPEEPDQISNFSAFAGLQSPCCVTCFESFDHTVKTEIELITKSLLKRAERLQKEEADDPKEELGIPND